MCFYPFPSPENVIRGCSGRLLDAPNRCQPSSIQALHPQGGDLVTEYCECAETAGMRRKSGWKAPGTARTRGQGTGDGDLLWDGMGAIQQSMQAGFRLIQWSNQAAGSSKRVVFQTSLSSFKRRNGKNRKATWLINRSIPISHPQLRPCCFQRYPFSIDVLFSGPGPAEWFDEFWRNYVAMRSGWRITQKLSHPATNFQVQLSIDQIYTCWGDHSTITVITQQWQWQWTFLCAPFIYLLSHDTDATSMRSVRASGRHWVVDPCWVVGDEFKPHFMMNSSGRHPKTP